MSRLVYQARPAESRADAGIFSIVMASDLASASICGAAVPEAAQERTSHGGGARIDG